MEIDMASNAPSPDAKLYFTTAISPGYSDDKRVEFSVRNNGNWYTYTVYMRNNPEWQGTITGIKIDPAAFGKSGVDDSDTIGFDWIKFINTNMKPVIVSVAPEYLVYNQGDLVTFNYWIMNPFANEMFDTEIYAMVKPSNSGSGWIDANYWPYERIVTLGSATYHGPELYQKAIVLPSSASTGSYDAYVRIAKQQSGLLFPHQSSVYLYDEKDLSSAFTVNAPNPVIIDPTPTPTSAPTYSPTPTPTPAITPTWTPLPESLVRDIPTSFKKDPASGILTTFLVFSNGWSDWIPLSEIEFYISNGARYAKYPSDPNPFTLNWHLDASIGGSLENSIAIPPDTLLGEKSVRITYDLHGLCALGSDASAIAFEQGEWKYVSLSNYGENCKDGEQTANISLADFPGLDTNAPLTGSFHIRFWNETAYTVDIKTLELRSDLPGVIPTPTVTAIATSTPTVTPTPAPTPSDTIVLNWHITGNNGDAQAYYGLPEDILKGKTSITLTYDLHGICFGGGDESAIIFNQNGWRYISLSSYGENCKDGEQTVTIPLSDFPNLDTNANLTGSFQARFWNSEPFTVDISSVKFNSELVLTPTATPTSTPTPVPTITASPTPTPTLNSNTIQLNWHLVGNNGAAEADQNVAQDILNGKTSINLTYDLHGLCALDNDASAIIFDQGDWRYVSLSNYGENCKDGEQTVTIPLSDFPNLDTSAPLTGSFHTRFWSSGPFTVDIPSVTWN